MDRRTLSTKEQQNFLTAVKCLKTQPGKTQSTYAGVRSRYDDFQALHINRTDFIHFVVSSQIVKKAPRAATNEMLDVQGFFQP